MHPGAGAAPCRARPAAAGCAPPRRRGGPSARGRRPGPCPPPPARRRSGRAAGATSWRAASPVIQRLVPSGAAVRASRLAAILRTTQGCPVVRCLRYGASCSATSSAATPTVTSMPAARSAASPRPATWGSGSSTPTTTRATPAATMASVQGGVRPWWAQGSSVAYSVAPRAASPAAVNAATSACGPPGGAVAPSKVVPAAAAVGRRHDHTAHPGIGCGAGTDRCGQRHRPAHVLHIVHGSRPRAGASPACHRAIIEHVPVFVERAWSAGQPCSSSGQQARHVGDDRRVRGGRERGLVVRAAQDADHRTRARRRRLPRGR